MFRKNINYLLAVQRTSQKEIADKLGLITQTFSRKLGTGKWSLEDLKKLFEAIYNKKVYACFVDRDTGSKIVTEDLNLILQKKRISKVELTSVLNVQRVRVYTKFSRHSWFKDDLIKVADIAGYDFVFCDEDQNVIYKFTEDDLSSANKIKRRKPRTVSE